MDYSWQFSKKFLMFIVLLLGLAQIFGPSAVIQSQEDLDVTAVVPGVAPPGGGGGSSGSGSNNATVVMSGNTFPNARLTLLKDGVVATTLFANPDGSFQITVNNLHYGNYQFSLIAEDSTGNFTSPYTINVGASSNQPYVYSGIVMPPTINVNNTLIKAGANFAVTGYSIPNSTVIVEAPGGVSFGTTTAGSDGFYSLSVRASVPPDLYSIRALARFNNIASPFSRPIQILIYSGQLPVPGPGQPQPPTQLATCVDYNKDGRVNLIDFSILLFWFGKNNPPSTIDCNTDSVIDLKDFSILMYFWTG